jgi:hypothetical protein
MQHAALGRPGRTRGVIDGDDVLTRHSAFCEIQRLDTRSVVRSTVRLVALDNDDMPQRRRIVAHFRMIGSCGSPQIAATGWASLMM